MRPRISTSRDRASRYEGASAFSSHLARTATISRIHRYSTERYPHLRRFGGRRPDRRVRHTRDRQTGRVTGRPRKLLRVLSYRLKLGQQTNSLRSYFESLGLRETARIARAKGILDSDRQEAVYEAVEPRGATLVGLFVLRSWAFIVVGHRQSGRWTQSVCRRLQRT